jgi:hypothetical protein
MSISSHSQSKLSGDLFWKLSFQACFRVPPRIPINGMEVLVDDCILCWDRPMIVLSRVSTKTLHDYHDSA